MYLMCGPKQLLFFQCVPEMPKGWTPLAQQQWEELLNVTFHMRDWPKVNERGFPLLHDLETEASRGSLTRSAHLLIPNDPHLPNLPDSALRTPLIPPSPTSHQVPSALSSQNLSQLPLPMLTLVNLSRDSHQRPLPGSSLCNQH